MLSDTSSASETFWENSLTNALKVVKSTNPLAQPFHFFGIYPKERIVDNHKHMAVRIW